MRPMSVYPHRRCSTLSNHLLEITVTHEGGHIAAVTDLASKVNPLWSPPWPSIEPSQYDPSRHPEYGADSESRLLAGILGHNLCLDLFGGPSPAESAAGMTVHGEAPVALYQVSVQGDTLTQTTSLPMAQLRFARAIRLPPGSRVATITETVENLSALDRPIAWTQHVTLGPPFLQKGRTQFRANATKSKVMESDFTGGRGYMKIGAEFSWPMAPRHDGGQEDMRVFTNRAVSGAFSTHLMDPESEHAWFLAWNPDHRLAFGYIWRREDFPWLGIWEENCSRTQPPWNGKTITRGMEFGVSPFPESRRAMIDRHGLFGVPGYRWVPARSTIQAEYRLFFVPSETAPDAPPLPECGA